MIATQTVSIVITTKNRKSDLKKCLDTCFSQRNIDEVLVFDDGGNDGSYEFVIKNYPLVSVFRSETSLGLINARTKCASIAKGDIIISIDDDCIFQNETTLEEIIPFFSDPSIAAVTIPCIDVLIDPQKITQAGIGTVNDVYIRTQFRGCAHAIRKNVFLKLGGYYNNLFRQEEESEFGGRLWKHGYKIRVGICEYPILHYHSAVRNEKQISYYRARNQIIVNYRLVPLLLLPVVAFKQNIQTLIYDAKKGRLSSSLRGTINGLKQIICGKIKRDNMGLKAYLEYKEIRMKQIKRISI
jgi:GT2 family glycosyltransferase